MKPETVIRWHRAGVRFYWTWRSRRQKPGRPPMDRGIRDLIYRMVIGDTYICRSYCWDERAVGLHLAGGALPSATKTPRDWRTRPDPFAEVWDTEIVFPHSQQADK